MNLLGVLLILGFFLVGKVIHGARPNRGIKTLISKFRKTHHEDEDCSLQSPDNDPRAHLFLNSSITNMTLVNLTDGNGTETREPQVVNNGTEIRERQVVGNGTETREPQVVHSKGKLDLLKPRTTIGTVIRGAKRGGFKKFISKLKKTNEEDYSLSDDVSDPRAHPDAQSSFANMTSANLTDGNGTETQEPQVVRGKGLLDLLKLRTTVGTATDGAKPKRGIEKLISKLKKTHEEDYSLQTPDYDPRAHLYAKFLNSSFANMTLADLTDDNDAGTREPQVVRGKGILDLLKPRTTVDPKERLFGAYLKHLNDQMTSTKATDPACETSEREVLEVTCSIKPNNKFESNHVTTEKNDKDVDENVYECEDGDQEEEVICTSEVNEMQETTKTEDVVTVQACEEERSFNIYPENDIRYILPQKVVVP